MIAEEIHALLDEETERADFAEAHSADPQAQLDGLLLDYFAEIARANRLQRDIDEFTTAYAGHVRQASRLQRDLDFARAGWLALSEAVRAEQREGETAGDFSV